MIVTIDATSALLRSAGVKNYIYYWVRALRANAPKNTANFAQNHGENHAKTRENARAQNIDIRAFPYLNDFGALDHEASTLSRFETIPRLGLLYLSRDSALLDWIVRDSDIFHASNQVRRAPKNVKLTATLHDLTCWLMPEFHTAGNIRADANFAEKILKKADGLIAVSENTRNDAIRLLGIAPDRIETIYSGVAEEYFDAKPAKRAKPYALYLGTIEPRKNIDVLLDSWREMRADLRENFGLVIAGPEGWGVAKTMARVRSEATYLGYVPEADLPSLIAGAAVFCYPSLYEGFGFPVAQAMAARVPVITSNSSSLGEIARDAAILVDPKSTAEITRGLTRLLESESLRAEIAARGRERANQFRWEVCAAKSLAFFERLL